MRKWIMVIDVAKCQDCNNCFLSCKDEHVGNDWLPYSVSQPLHGQRWMDIKRKERGSYPMVDVYFRPTPCRHCEQPECMVAAENGAVYKREDGIVIIDPEKAKGQRKIAGACPYGAIYWNEEKEIPQKCTFCAHLLDQGWEQPRCVQVCPTGALSFIRLTGKELVEHIAREQLEPVSGNNHGAAVYYKNLSYYRDCFIGGSVSYWKNDCKECAEGAEVILMKDNQEVQKTVTDCYGDFKFDGLKNEKALFSVDIRFKGATASVATELHGSLYIGDVSL